MNTVEIVPEKCYNYFRSAVRLNIIDIGGKMKKRHLIVPLLLLLIILCSCTKGSGIMKNATEINTPTKMSMMYDKFTGFKETTIRVDKENPITISVNITTVSGKIDAYIAKENDKSDTSYEGNDIPTSSFTVTLSEAGDYTIRVDADDHSGGYSFSWQENN
jgi:hypothetical protein